MMNFDLVGSQDHNPAWSLFHLHWDFVTLEQYCSLFQRINHCPSYSSRKRGRGGTNCGKCQRIFLHHQILEDAQLAHVHHNFNSHLQIVCSDSWRQTSENNS